MPSIEITVYQVVLTGTLQVEAGSTQEAIDKTVAYFAAHLDELNYQVSSSTVLMNGEE